MNTRFALLAVAGMLTVTAAPGRVRPHHEVAPDPCTQPDDRAAFDVMSLKSELTVIALNCHEQERYNTFMRTYQPAIAAADHTLVSYFKRVYGRKYQTEHDEYITNLAAVEEQEGLKSGTAYCGALSDMFDEVMSLHDASELADFGNSQALVQPVPFTKCSTVVAAKPTPAKRRSKHKTA
jgi:hypothetical protein